MAMPKGRGEYCYDYDRRSYQHRYYLRNKLRKRYTYIKKGAMKRLAASQFSILKRVRRGIPLYLYLDDYRYFENGKYHMVNRRSVGCLLASGHLQLNGTIATATQKGRDHIQSIPKNQLLISSKKH